MPTMQDATETHAARPSGLLPQCVALFSLTFLGLAAVRVWLQCCVYDLYSATDSGLASVAVNLMRGAVTLVLMAIALRKPFSTRTQNWMGVACALAMTAACGLLLAADETGATGLGWAACLFAALGVVWGGGMWICLYERLQPEEALFGTFVSLALSCLAGLVLGLLPKTLAMLVAALMPVTSLVAFRSAMLSVDERDAGMTGQEQGERPGSVTANVGGAINPGRAVNPRNAANSCKAAAPYNSSSPCNAASTRGAINPRSAVNSGGAGNSCNASDLCNAINSGSSVNIGSPINLGGVNNLRSAVNPGSVSNLRNAVNPGSAANPRNATTPCSAINPCKADTLYDCEPPTSFVRLLFGVALFSLALGFARGFPYGQAIALSAALRVLHQLVTCLLCLGVVWWALVRRRHIRFAMLWNIPLTLLIVGVLLLACLTPQLMEAGSALVTVANTFTLAILWYASYDVARHMSRPAYLVLGCVWVAHQVPRELGRIVAMAVGPYDSSPMLLALVMVVLLAGSMFMLITDSIPRTRPLFADLGSGLAEKGVGACGHTPHANLQMSSQDCAAQEVPQNCPQNSSQWNEPSRMQAGTPGRIQSYMSGYAQVGAPEYAQGSASEYAQAGTSGYMQAGAPGCAQTGMAGRMQAVMTGRAQTGMLDSAQGTDAVRGFTPLPDSPSTFSTIPADDARLLLMAQHYQLTRRELDIARLLVEGLSKSQAGERLCLSESTVRTHARNLYAKLDVHSREQLKQLMDEFGHESSR